MRSSAPAGRAPAPAALVLGALLAAAASVPAAAGPIFEPGARVIVTAIVDTNCGELECPNVLVSDRIAATGTVGVSVAERGAGFARAEANLVTGALRAASGSQSLHQTGGALPNTSSRAEAAYFEVAQIVGPPGGPGPLDMFGVSFTTNGNVVLEGLLYVEFGFWMRDATIPRIDPNNPDAPVTYLLRYSGQIFGGMPFSFLETSLSGTDASFARSDPTDLAVGVAFDLSGTIRAAALGTDPLIEFGAYLYTFVQPNARAIFENTARLQLSLPEGYRLVSPSGFLSGAGAPPGGSPPTGVPAPGAIGLLGVALLGLVTLRPRRRA